MYLCVRVQFFMKRLSPLCHYGFFADSTAILRYRGRCISNHEHFSLPVTCVGDIDIARQGILDVYGLAEGWHQKPIIVIVIGIDRIIMLLAGATNLREVALFPMNQQAVDLLMGAPSEASPKQLREAHLRINAPEKNG